MFVSVSIKRDETAVLDFYDEKRQHEGDVTIPPDVT